MLLNARARAVEPGIVESHPTPSGVLRVAGSCCSMYYYVRCRHSDSKRCIELLVTGASLATKSKMEEIYQVTTTGDLLRSRYSRYSAVGRRITTW